MISASSNGGPGSPDRPSDRSTRFPDVISLPLGTLARHRARLLEPSTAVRAHDGSWPLSTAYRADSLLLPAREAQGLLPEEPNDYNRALEALGVELRPSGDEGWRDSVRRVHPDLPVPVPLVTRQDQVTDRPPDPWAALVTLRRAFGDKRGSEIGLNHLVLSASVTVEGAPINHGGNVDGAPINHGGGMGDGRITLYTGSRNPVAMLGKQPARRRPADLPGKRRPVVAVLDTGIGRHDWLTVGPVGMDPVVEVSPAFQQDLAVHEPGAGTPHPLLAPEDQPDEIQPLLGFTDSHFGHGTFVAGLVHQMCPDARILSLRVLETDGCSTEGSVLFALDWLRRRVADAIADDTPDQLVDVVSLSLGFYPETATPSDVLQISAAIERLTDLGVLVVAAAGNDATTRPFLPAAFGQDSSATTGNPLLAAIGALNASGVTTAAFSNHGPWVCRWAPGNALVSTVPMVEGVATGGFQKLDGAGVGPRWRTGPDPDDLRTGFAVWAGTSFATPVVAGLLANALCDSDAAARSFGADRAVRALELTDAELTERGWR